MAKRKPEEPPKGTPEWMATYSDLVTLLFCFFVLLYSMSNVDAAKFQQLASSFSGAPLTPFDSGSGAGIGDLLGNGIMDLPNTDQGINDSLLKYKEMQEELERMASEWKTYFAENNMSDQIKVTVAEQSIRFEFQEGILFDSGKAILKPEAYNVLPLLGDIMEEHPNWLMRIEGHTDNVPINTAQYPNNWYLSYARAAAVLMYFTDEVGVDPRNITPLGLGEYSPIDTNDTPEGRAKNRRVEILLMSEYYSDANKGE